MTGPDEPTALETLRKGYDLSRPSDRLPFVRAVAREIRKQVMKERLDRDLDQWWYGIKSLTEGWYPGDPEKARTACLEVEQEINRIVYR